MTVLMVGLAGLAGVLARYGISYPFHGDTLPWVTVSINVAGSFALGLLVAAAWFSTEVRTALGVGFLGGFTTFSTFAVQAVIDVDAGRPGRAAIYLGISLVAGIGAATAGYALGRALV
jgi:CrcB protein